MKSRTTQFTDGGYTLVEVIIAIVLLALVGIGISQNLVMTRGISETNIRESTAIAAASGYMEQIKSMDYERVLSSVRDPDLPIPMILAQGVPDPIVLGKWVEKTIVIDEDAQTGKERTMPFHVQLTIEDLAASNNGEALAVTILYAWEDAKSGLRRERSLRTIRSLVPTF
jgi:prepilin-type N-terminal cleavage/methylation domain-containing protein